MLRSGGDDKPWCDSEIRSFTRKRDKQKRKAIKSGNLNDWGTYKKLRNKVNNLKKHAKELFFNNLELSISDFYNNDKKKFWKVIRHFIKNKESSSLLPPILDPDITDQNKFGFLDSERLKFSTNTLFQYPLLMIVTHIYRISKRKVIIYYPV